MMDITINCGACSKPVTARVGEAQIVNLEGVSMLVMAKEELIGCPHCRRYLKLELVNVQGFLMRTVVVQRPTSLILPLVAGN